MILMMPGLRVAAPLVILDSGVNIDAIKVARMLKKTAYGNLAGTSYVMERSSHFTFTAKSAHRPASYGLFYNPLLSIGNCSLVANRSQIAFQFVTIS